MDEALTPLLDALANDDDVAALDAAVEAWREFRNPTLAAIIRMLDVRIRKGHGGLAGRSSLEFHDSWTAVAEQDHSVEATGLLASTLGTKVPEGRGMWTRDRYGPWIKRLSQLAARTPDPRIGDAVLAVIEAGRVATWAPDVLRDLYTPLAELLTAAGDPSLVPRIDKAAATPRVDRAWVRTWCRRALPDVARQLAQITVFELPPEIEARLAAQLPNLRNPGPPEAVHALTARILEDPGNRDLRAVLADLLIEQGDPRGTFIARQLAGAADTEPETARMLRAHRRSWLGDDLHATLSVSFVDGFPHTATLRRSGRADVRVWANATQDPRLGTLHTLRKGEGHTDWFLGFAERAPNLVRVRVPSRHALLRLARRRSPSLRALELAFDPNAEDLHRIATVPAFRHVTTLGLHRPADLTAFAALFEQPKSRPLTERLHTLELGERHGVATGVLASWQALPASLPVLVRIEVLRPAQVAYRFDLGPQGWTMTFEGPAGPLPAEVGIVDAPDVYTLTQAGLDEWRRTAWAARATIELMPKPALVQHVYLDAADSIRREVAARWNVPVERPVTA